LPYARILDRMVTIKDGLGARQVTAEEAFLFYLRKKAVDGRRPPVSGRLRRGDQRFESPQLHHEVLISGGGSPGSEISTL
jgi:hypothetical protein